MSGDVTYVDHQSYDPRITTSGKKIVDLHLWNIGLRGNYDDIAGTGIGIRADLELQTGKITYGEVPGAEHIKLRGWAIMAGLDYKFKSIPLSLTLEYALGSGDKDSTTDKREGFITALGQEQHYTFVYEYLTPSACNMLRTTNLLGTDNERVLRSGLCNTQYVKLGGAYDITKDLKAELYGYWLRAHRAVAINDNPDTSNRPKKDKDIGWEVDVKLTYQIDKGLTYFIEGGYFWPGDAYKLPGVKDADDAWGVRHGITLRF